MEQIGANWSKLEQTGAIGYEFWFSRAHQCLQEQAAEALSRSYEKKPTTFRHSTASCRSRETESLIKFEHGEADKSKTVKIFKLQE